MMKPDKVYKHKTEECYLRQNGGITETSIDFVVWEPLINKLETGTYKLEAGTYVEMSDAEVKVALEAALIKIRGGY